MSTPSKRPFYRTEIKVVVLSEEPLGPETDLDTIHYLITEGDCSGSLNVVRDERVDGPTMAKALIEQGSDPTFFRLTEDGEDIED